MARKSSSRMSKRGKGSTSFSTNQPVSTTAKPRSSGPAGKNGNWRAGIPMAGKGKSAGKHPAAKTPQTTQGGSTANMGDACPANGHNTPRGSYNQADAQRGMFAAGSTPLAKTGTRKGKVQANPAAQVTGPYGW